MADAFEVQIADAVVAELNDPARSWSPEIAAARLWLPIFKAEDLAVLKVSVVPLTIDQDRAARGLHQFGYGVAIDFQKMVNPTDMDAIDALSRLAEQVHDFYRDAHKLATLPAWEAINAVRESVYDLDRLYVDHTWETMIVLTARGFR
jgi:hypothetical protein